MLGLELILLAVVLLAGSGLPGLFFSAHSLHGQRAGAGIMMIGSGLGLAGVVASSNAAAPLTLHIPWVLPWGRFSVAVDPISAVFLGIIFIVPALGSIYGLGYWKQSEHPENGRKLGLFWGLLAGSMAMVAIARDGVLFLIAWEIMAMAAFFTATVEEDNPEVRRAGWIYLIATHIGTLCLIAMFLLWRHATGSFALETATAMPIKTAGMIFVLALVGFGFKAGLMPLHVWLPGAHANAPSHVSAVMSGVMLKLGIYGLVRMTAVLPVGDPWWGGVLLLMGATSGLAGITFAISQYDIKRVLAYSSIENIGIIAMGLGLALLGRSLGRWDWVLLGMGGALLHVWNHSLFKSLLFFNAGAIMHATHTRNMDHLGGLGRHMPKTMLLFLVGAVAICGLPPLNGFVSEWLLYIGLFHTLGFNGGGGIAAAATAAVALSMIGALAVACFVKFFGAVFLGTPRGAESAHAHDPATGMVGVMAALALACAGIGVFPMLVTPVIEAAAKTWAGPQNAMGSLAGMIPLTWIAVLGIGFVALMAVLAFLLGILPRAKKIATAGTWDCGYAQPTTRMQYTGSSLAQTLVTLSNFILRPQIHWPALRSLFPGNAHFKTLVTDTVLDRLVLPLSHAAGRNAPRVRVLQQGQLHLYLLYVLIITIVLLFFWGVGV